MTTQTKLKGHWQEAKGRVKEAWGVLTDDDIERTKGDWDQLLGVIRQKSGEGIDSIEQKLNDILDSVSEGSDDDR